MIPYQSLHDAEISLGRNLTFAETLWFNYSATKSDYFLFCHNILFLFLIFSLVPLPLVFLEIKRLYPFDEYKIQPKVRLSLHEMLNCYKDVMKMFFLVVGPLQLISYPSIKVIAITVYCYSYDFCYVYLVTILCRWLELGRDYRYPLDLRFYRNYWCIFWWRIIPITGSIDFCIINGDMRRFIEFIMNIKLRLDLRRLMHIGPRSWFWGFRLFLGRLWFLVTWLHFGCGLHCAKLKPLIHIAGTTFCLFYFLFDQTFMNVLLESALDFKDL